MIDIIPQKLNLPIILKVEIIESNWLINGKSYSECGFVERYYFDIYLRIKLGEYPETTT